MTKRITIFTYGVICYAIFFATFCYACGFVGNIIVPRSIDSTPVIPMSQALIVNIALLAVFAIQHSVMARPAFKRWWTKFVPEPAERSTYVLFSSVALIALFVFWQPMGGTIWNIQDPVGRIAMYSVFGFGWALVLVTTFVINHFDLFGLRQVWLYLRGIEYTPLKFKVPGPYRFVRHPLYVGWFCAFWGTPTMTVAHFVFAVMTAAYILVAIYFEERDLIAHFGQRYVQYRRQVPMLIPRFVKRYTGGHEATETE